MPTARGTRFVGRGVELAALRGELDAALAGEGRLVVLLGEAGIGKTRTATTLAAEARERGVAVVHGRCHDGGVAPAYWPWIQVLSAFTAEHAGKEARDESAALLADLRLGSDHSDSLEAPDRARFELYFRVAAALTSAARARPLLILLDDLQWADSGSLLLLELVAREASTIPLLVLGTARDGEMRAASAARLNAVVRLGRSLLLNGFTGADARDLLAERLGHAPREDFVDRVVALTNGNPFFILETMHLLGAGHMDVETTPLSGKSIPPGVQELLRQRLAPLPASTMRLLEVASVLGRDFDLRSLAAVRGHTREELLAELAPALGAGIVCELDGAAQRCAFAHALMRESLYGALPPQLRMALHAAVAAALESAEPHIEVAPATLAHHFFAAGGEEDLGKAIRYACAAGERALDVLAFEEAARHFERALAAATSADDALRLRLLAGLGAAVHGGGDPERSAALFTDAIAVARRCGDTAFAETVLRCAAVRTEFNMTDVELNALLAEALQVVPPELAALRARLMARLAAGLSLQPGAERRRRELADEATALARRLGDPAILSFVLERRLIALLGPDTLAERLATTEEILDATISGRQGKLSALIFRADDLAQQGDRAALDQTLAVLEERTRNFPQPFFAWIAATIRSAMALLEGRFGEAEALANEALTAGQRVQTRTAVLYYGEQMLLLRSWQGRMAEIEPFVEMSAKEAAMLPAWRCALAEFYAVSGRHTEARREFAALAADDFATLPRDTTWLQGMYLLAGTCSTLGDVAGAAVLYRLLQPFAGRVAVGWPVVVLVGPIDARLATLATVLQRYHTAEQHFADALAMAERLRGLPWQAEIRQQWARMLYQRGDSGDGKRAEELLDEAESIASSLGMALLLDWIGATRAMTRPIAASRAAGAAGDAADAANAPPTSLPRNGSTRSPAARAATFRREGDVWTLAFENCTTRLHPMRGIVHIARLLSAPGREIHVLDLAADPSPMQRQPAASADAGELLDTRARAEYESRLRDARAELAEAEEINDGGRAERLREEIEFLAAELVRGLGLGGRHRRAGSASERARVAVTRAIKYAIDRIAENDPALAEHLRLAVRTGTFCSYAPPSRDRVTWTL